MVLKNTGLFLIVLVIDFPLILAKEEVQAV
jgi:hypothetical protein